MTESILQALMIRMRNADLISRRACTLPRVVWGAAVGVRLVLVFYSGWMDAHSEVKYTDVDYMVYSDAAREVAAGRSPYDRATFRYTPLLAWMLLPNVWFELWGKLLFCAFDILIGVLIVRILRMRGLAGREATCYAAAFLLHPMAINVSSRGNGDSVVCALILATAYLLLSGREVAAAVAYGLAVHVKIFPIVYVPALWLFIDRHQQQQQLRGVKNVGGALSGAHGWLAGFFTRRRLCFGAVSGGVFALVTLFFYRVYGFVMLYETYLYHAVRSDNRHNFSPYFYDAYLATAAAAAVEGTAASTAAVVADSSAPLAARFLFWGARLGDTALRVLPQWGTVLTLGALLSPDLPLALFAQTFAFVSLNKVVTAQYFHWHICLLPLVIPGSELGWVRGGALAGLWLVSELLWLLPAFFLELRGQSVFLWVWAQGLLFLAANSFILASLLRNQQLVSWPDRGDTRAERRKKVE